VIKRILALILVLAFVFVLIGCDSGQSYVPLAPPAWIQGDWVLNPAGAEVLDFSEFKFSADDVNVKFSSSNSWLSFKIAYVPSTVTEHSSNTQYYISALYNDGNFVIYDFEPVTSASFKLYYTTSSVLERSATFLKQ
jgi:hypothetical protein